MYKITLPENVKTVISRIEKSGYSAYTAGGCVRDSILSGYFNMPRTPQDWDITTSAPPESVINIFSKSRTIPTGLQHGTVTVLVAKDAYEVTTYRIDGDYKDGRHPDNVVFTDQIADDLSRRDFTINAMAYNDTAGLIDLFGGIDDLQAKIIRCVGDASARFSEDYLRMLRAYRFAAVLGFTLDPDIINVCADKKHALNKISAERIREEFNKLITADNPALITDFFDVFADVLFPELCEDTKHLKSAVALMLAADADIRLAALLCRFAPAVAEAVLRRLKYDNKTADSIIAVTANFGYQLSSDKPVIKRLINRIGYANAETLLRLRSPEYLDALKEIAESGEACFIKDLAISGGDIMRILDVKPGKIVGEKLEELLEFVMDKPELNEFERLKNLLR